MNIPTRKFPATAALMMSLCMTSVMTTGTASASDRRVATERFTEYADVVDVRPVYKNIRVSEPRQECWTETRRHIVGYESPRYEHHEAYRSERRHSSSGAVVGGLIGGVVGNQLGRGHSSSSRTGATIAGAIIGGAVGNEASGEVLRHRRPQTVRRQGAPIYETEEVERCKQVAESRLEQRVQHYDVTYRYKGRTFTTRMRRDPGSQIELQVNVSPARQ